jgi:DHA2 family lincomycin resistance protein-like MFS transporter
MQKERKFNVNLAVLATGIMAFSGVLIETAMNVTFPTLIKQFHIETAQVQWVTTIYLLMISIIVPLSSYLIKNYSMKNLFIFSIGTFLAGVIINCIPLSFSFLLFGRMLQGVATGIALPLMFNIILTKVPLEKRGLMIGVGTLTTSIAPALGPTYGGLLTSSLGWPFIYILLVPILIAAALIGLVAIPQEKVKKTTTLNIPAALALAVVFSCLLLSFSYFGKPLFWIIIALAVVSGKIFMELNKKNQLLNLAVFKNSVFCSYLFGFLTFQAMLLGISFIIPNFMQFVFKATSSKAGMMMFLGALVGAFFAPVSGKILDSLGAKKPILAGLVFAIIGWLGLSFALPTGSTLLVVACHVLFMIGVGLAYSNTMTMGLSALTTAEYADGNAVFTALQQLIGAIATAFVALVMGIFQKSEANFIEGTLLGTRIDMYGLLLLLILSLVIVIKALFTKQTQDKAPS